MTKPFNGQQLVGHVSPETAFVVADYPYGFKLRCQMRYWIESKPGYGQRFVSQTSNPKKPGLVWNKPKAGVYALVVVMYRDQDTGYVKHAVLTPYNTDLESIEGWGLLDLDPFQLQVQKSLLTYARKQRGA